MVSAFDVHILEYCKYLSFMLKMLSSPQQVENPEPEIEDSIEKFDISNLPEEKHEKSDFLTKLKETPLKRLIELIEMAGLGLSKCHYISLSVNISAV
jgi:hypothetical protein